MIRPLLFLVGYHILSFPEERSADVVNLCASLSLVYHDLGVGNGRRRLRLSPYACGALCRALRVRDIEHNVEQRYGFPELIRGVLHRPGIILGLIVFSAVIALSQRVIWDVRVEGNKKVSEETVESLLLECGIGVGSSKKGLDIDAIENKVLILSDEISWISVNVLGNIAEVEIREVSSVPEDEDYVASNLVAKRNGTVVEFVEVKGNIAVELGEAVSEGQLLVGGIYGSDTEGLRFVRSRGSVIALCDREYHVEIPLTYDKKAYTGRKKVKKSLIFFEKEVKFFRNSRNLYASCDTIDKVEYLNFFGLGDLPVGIRTVTYVEYELVEGVRSEEQAAEQASFELWQRFYADAPDAAVAKKSLDGRLEGDTYILDAYLECLEDIAEEKKIDVEIVG